MDKFEKLNKLKNNYVNIDIPKDLDKVVNDAINNQSRSGLKMNKTLRKRIAMGSTAAAIALMVIGVNTNTAFASTLESIPVVGSIIKVINFNTYKLNENGFEANISVPNVEGLKDVNSQNDLNNKLQSEGIELYNKVLEEKDTAKEGHLSVNSSYKVIVDNDKYMTIAVNTTEVQASGYDTVKYYNIDKSSEKVLTLESVCNNKKYVDIISENVLSQMKEQMANDSGLSYFIADDEIPEAKFTKIKPDQNFYINDNGELVISFDEYEVAPGYMGIREFVIPSSVISINK